MIKTLISKTLIFQKCPQFPPQITPSFYTKNHSLFHLPSRKQYSYKPKIQTFCTPSPSDSLTYGGWDDFQLSGDSAISGESTQLLQTILNSLGINDKKYIFVYLLGCICALAVTRIRVSSIIAVPACVLVFAVGFSIGYFNGGHLSFSGVKKRPKEEILRDSTEKLRNLLDMLSGIYVNIVSFKDGIKKNIENNRITVNDLEVIVKTAESIDLSVLDAKSIIECLIERIATESGSVEKSLNQKSSRRRKEVGEKGFDLLWFIAGLFQENSSGLDGSKVRNLNKKELEDVEINDGKQRNILAPAVEEQIPSTVLNRGGDDSNGSANKASIAWDKAENLINGSRMNVAPEHGRMDLTGMDVSEAASGRKEYHYRNKRFQNFNGQQASPKTKYPNRATWDSHDALFDSMDLTVHLRRTKTEASFRQEREVRDWKENDLYSNHVEEAETETDVAASVREKRANQAPSIIREDTEFSKYLTEANILLKEVKKVLIQQVNDRHAEDALYQSARLLSKAIDIRPMSLLAVGQLGNTYLLHGELKLRTSRELRAVIAGNDPRSIDKWGLDELDDQLATKDKLTSILVNVCEECEELLIKAGRNYRLALSIDGNDMRALYNWGLALSFRGQLIADIGPGAAHDADKLLLAAIDKFDAMLSKGNVYAPDALFRWGAALQQRSRLRRWNSKEKVKLLQQARRFYEDALDMDSDNGQVQEALISCLSELNFSYS